MKNTHIIQKIIVLMLVFCTAAQVMAQTDADALRFSTMQVGSTARSMGMGGTLGAIGADFSAAASNPAGLANFRQGELAFSPGFHLTMTEATAKPDKSSLSDNTQTFIFPHFGLILPYVNDDHKWKSVVTALGIQRTGNFNQRTFYSTTATGSIADYFAASAQGTAPANLDSYGNALAFNTYLIDTVGGSTSYVSALQNANTLLTKSQTITTSGGVDEVTIALAGNYQNRFNIGATLGIPILNYTEKKTYTETSNGTDNGLRSTEFREYVNTSGVGINMKIGATYRLAQAFRIGLAVHTPTYYSLRDTFNNTMTSNTRSGNGEVKDQALGSIYNYSLITPTRLLANATILISPSRNNISGMLNGEVEYSNMGSARFVLDGTNVADKAYQSTLNSSIKNKYGNTLTARVGGEIAIDVFRIRAGYARTISPFKAGIVEQPASLQQFSGGIGVRERRYYIDLGYMNTVTSNEYTPYVTALSPVNVARKLDNHTIVMTFGFKFN